MGRMTQRVESDMTSVWVYANENLTETFTYDNLNRVTSATVSQNIAPVKNVVYDAIGNLLSKSDVGTYTYPARRLGPAPMR